MKKGKNQKDLEDPRFSHISWDPKFRRIPRQERKVVVDKRFSAMFSDPEFQHKSKVDERGRTVNQSSKNNLKKFYDLQSDSDCEEDEILVAEDTKEDDSVEPIIPLKSKKKKDKLELKKKESKPINVHRTLTNEDSAEEDSDSQNIKLDLARGEGNVDSSSSDSDAEWGVDEAETEHQWGEMDKDAPRAELSTSRVAIMHIDWDRIRAIDLFVLLNSFKPDGGSVLSVTIYPSQYGKECMALEDQEGPKQLAKDLDREADSDQDNEGDLEEGEMMTKAQNEKLREYQLSRLKYFYAVVECDSTATAEVLYKACDGMEFESSSARIDLRFIPDEMQFDDDPKERVDHHSIDLTNYEPRFFANTALQQSKVVLTWDENDPHREKRRQDAFNPQNLKEERDRYLKDFVVGDSGSEESEQDEERKSKWDSLLSSLRTSTNGRTRDKDKEEGLELTWEPGFKDTNATLEKDGKTKLDDKSDWDKYLERRNEKRKNRKQKLKELKKQSKAKDEDESDDELLENTEKDEVEIEEQSATDSDNNDLELLAAETSDATAKHHFSLKRLVKTQLETEKQNKKRKRLAEPDKVKPAEQFDMDLKDPRFSSLYNSHLFNIDPTDPHFKRTAGSLAIINEKLRRKEDKGDGDSQSKEIEITVEKRDAGRDIKTLIDKVKKKSDLLVKKNKI